MSYSLSRCCQRSSMLQATRLSFSRTTPSHRAKDTIKQPQQETPDFIGPDLWPQNSPDLNLVDYKVWGVMQQTVYECRMNSVNELKLRLTDVWNSLQENVIDAAINDWRKQLRACVRACRWTTFWTLTCDFRGLRVSKGKVRTINRWGGISNHLSMSYLLSNICTKNYWNRTTIVEIIVGGWVVSFFETQCILLSVGVITAVKH